MGWLVFEIEACRQPTANLSAAYGAFDLTKPRRVFGGAASQP